MEIDLMSNICRLCLTESNNIALNLREDRELFNKICKCLCVKISINKAFPDKLCYTCVNRIEETYNFHKAVKENQSKLYKLLRSGKEHLHDFYKTITNKINVKPENIDDESELFKYEYIDDEGGLVKHEVDSSAADENELVKHEDHSSAVDENSDDESNNLTLDHFPSDKEISTNMKCLDEPEIEVFKVEKEDDFDSYEESKQNGIITDDKDEFNKKFKDKEDIKEVFKSNPDINVIEKYLTSKYQCLTCFEKFEDIRDLGEHYTKQHLAKELNVKNYRKDKEHDILIKINENGVKMFGCLHCDKVYAKNRDILRHIDIHKDKRPLICKICGRTYRIVPDILRHGRVHYGEKLHCSYKCGYSTAYRGALRDHEKRKHSKADSKYKCEECGKGFDVRTWYEQHQNIHSGKRPYVCKICGTAFHMQKYLTCHLGKVHPQGTERKRFVCVQCSIPCDSMNGLRKHMETHGIKSTFLCELCGKVFQNSKQVTYHKNTHLGLKPFSCSVCKKSFSMKSHLKNHEQTHTKKRMHACVMCSKRFSQRYTMLQHIRRHHPDGEIVKIKP